MRISPQGMTTLAGSLTLASDKLSSITCLLCRHEILAKKLGRGSIMALYMPGDAFDLGVRIINYWWNWQI